MKHFGELVLFSLIICSAFAAKLPSYINKCTLSKPDLSQCITNSANIAIQNLIKGEVSLGIPVLSPLRIPRLDLFANDFKLVLKNVDFDGFKDLVVTKGSFNPLSGDAELIFAAKYLNFSSDYQIDNGHILTRLINGKGKFHMSLVGNVISYNSLIKGIEKDGESYFKTIEEQVKLTNERTNCNFEGLVNNSEDGKDIYAFLESHQDEIKAIVQPGLEKFFLTYISKLLYAVMSNVPRRDIFIE